MCPLSRLPKRLGIGQLSCGVLPFCDAALGGPGALCSLSIAAAGLMITGSALVWPPEGSIIAIRPRDSARV